MQVVQIPAQLQTQHPGLHHLHLVQPHRFARRGLPQGVRKSLTWPRDSVAGARLHAFREVQIASGT